MKLFKNTLYNLSNLLILVTISSSLVLIYAIKNNFLDINSSIFYVIAVFLVIIQSTIIMLLIKVNYEDPIAELEYNIKAFITGSLKGKELVFKKNINPHLSYILKFFTTTLNMLKNIRDEFVSGKAIKSEVDLAREIQEKLLNKKLEAVTSLEIIAKSKPAGEIGGDSYDIIKQGDNYYIYVGDATGHGVAAGFVMMMVNSLISGFSKIVKSGSQILSMTNEILKPRVKSNILMSLLLVRWNETEKRLFMTGAGHEYLMIYKANQQKCFKIKSGGIALGMTKDISKILKEQEIKFEIGDIIVLYSDGITEAINQNKKDGNESMYTEDRLIKSIENSPEMIINGVHKKTARGVFNNITIELSKFMGYKHRQYDDITLVVAHYTGGEIIENDFSEIIPDEFITEWNWN
ncbi:MAG: PP2C family protein-serine/threonine phosphatase [Candidatus Gracilibacteria bacterium]|nr:PP2C family protein-serine/threonine phosphatase [Candidatus Gracilibacteria bacterium]